MSVKLGILFSTLGVPPNAWTIGSLVPAVGGFLALFYQNLLTGFVLFSLSALLDAVDGAVARVTKSVSNLGAFLDGIIDRYVEILLYLGLLFYLKPHGTYFMPLEVMMIFLVFGSIMPSFARAYAHHRGVMTDPVQQRRMGGLMERAERVGLILAGMLAGHFLSLFWLYAAICAVVVLSNLTAVQRILFVIYYDTHKD